ncbi:MAG TPA: hypothetical protein VE866_02380 [Candidatus Binatia bacterium]|nr:hypothetical protein [Candidatus Binatia bacterium]
MLMRVMEARVDGNFVAGSIYGNRDVPAIDAVECVCPDSKRARVTDESASKPLTTSKAVMVWGRSSARISVWTFLRMAAGLSIREPIL